MTKYSQYLIGLSVIAGILAIVGAFGNDIWLASTQWMEVSILLAIYAIYSKSK